MALSCRIPRQPWQRPSPKSVFNDSALVSN